MKFFKLNDDDDNGTVGDGDDNNTNVDMNNNKDVADTVYKTKSWVCVRLCEAGKRNEVSATSIDAS